MFYSNVASYLPKVLFSELLWLFPYKHKFAIKTYTHLVANYNLKERFLVQEPCRVDSFAENN